MFALVFALLVAGLRGTATHWALTRATCARHTQDCSHRSRSLDGEVVSVQLGRTGAMPRRTSAIGEVVSVQLGRTGPVRDSRSQKGGNRRADGCRPLRDWAHPRRICTGIGLTPAHICTGARPNHICTGVGSPQPYLYRAGVGSPSHFCTGTRKRMQAAPRWRSKSWKMRATAKWMPSAIRRRFVPCALASTRVLQSISSKPANRALSGRRRQPRARTSTQRSGPHIQVVYFVVSMSSCVGIIVFIPFGFSAKNHKCAGSQRPKLNLTPFQCR
jgi:hypothetical protein